MPDRLKVLYLCTGNSCRSQMAEGWTRHLKGDVIEPYSAGIAPTGLDPLAVKVMAEAGVDIAAHRAKHVSELKDIEFDFVVTVCDHAHESCPLFPGKTKVVHVGFPDPPVLARRARTEAGKLKHYRRVRDEIRAFVERLPDVLALAQCPAGNSAGLTRAQVQAWLARLRTATIKKACRACDCQQALLTQLELDAATDVTALTAPLKTPRAKWHGCRGCDPCPPAALFAEYLRTAQTGGDADHECCCCNGGTDA